MTTPTEALAAATHEECEAFWAGLPPDVSISMHRADAHLEASERRLSALSSSGWSLVRTEGLAKCLLCNGDITARPGDPATHVGCCIGDDPSAPCCSAADVKEARDAAFAEARAAVEGLPDVVGEACNCDWMAADASPECPGCELNVRLYRDPARHFEGVHWHMQCARNAAVLAALRP